MSHDGTPPPEDPADQPEEQPEEQPGAPGSHAADPRPYNPYPTNWDAPPPNQGRFVGGAGGQVPADQAGSPGGGYGQLNPYAAAADPASPYGGQPSGGSPYGTNVYAGNPDPAKPTFGFGGYAGWFTRVGAYLIDQLLASVAGAPLWVGYAILIANTSTTTNPDGTTASHYSGSVAVPIVLVALGAVTVLAFYIWNICLRQGRTGASIGKSVLAVRLVNSDLQPIGAGTSFLRSILHIVDGIPCYLGYLWPIWDSNKQTFADKIVSSYVIQATTPQPRGY